MIPRNVEGPKFREINLGDTIRLNTPDPLLLHIDGLRIPFVIKVESGTHNGGFGDEIKIQTPSAKILELHGLIDLQGRRILGRTVPILRTTHFKAEVLSAVRGLSISIDGQDSYRGLANPQSLERGAVVFDFPKATEEGRLRREPLVDQDGMIFNNSTLRFGLLGELI